MAGALKDYKRAIIVGSSEQTHGKGTVQAILPLQDVINPLIKNMLPPIGAMKITTDMFYRINGMSTQFRGVKPDIILPDQYGYLESGEQSLDYAIPYTEVPAVKFKQWKKQKYDLGKLSSNSKKRVDKNSKFKKIESSVKWSKERKENTKRSLTLKDMEKFRKDAHEISEKYKVDEENPLIIVDHLKQPKNDVEKESFKEFEEELKKDPVIEETLYIMSDMLAQK